MNEAEKIGILFLYTVALRHLPLSDKTDERRDFFEHTISVDLISDIPHFAMLLCGDSLRAAGGSAVCFVDGCLSADSFVFLRKKIALRRKTQHSLYLGAFIFTRAFFFDFLSDEGRLGDGARVVCVVRALGASRIDPKAKNPLLLKPKQILKTEAFHERLFI